MRSLTMKSMASEKAADMFVRPVEGTMGTLTSNIAFGCGISRNGGGKGHS